MHSCLSETAIAAINHLLGAYNWGMNRLRPRGRCRDRRTVGVTVRTESDSNERIASNWDSSLSSTIPAAVC